MITGIGYMGAGSRQMYYNKGGRNEEVELWSGGRGSGGAKSGTAHVWMNLQGAHSHA